MTIDLRSLSTLSHLAMVTKCSEEQLTQFLREPSESLRHHSIARHDRSSAPRAAWEVVDRNVRTALRETAVVLDAFLRHWFPDDFPHPCVHGFITGRSALSNAVAHAGHTFFLHVDVREFFGSIQASMVDAALRGVGLSEAGARLLTSLTCVSGTLPLGFPTSPLVSNLVFLSADKELAALAFATGATYTRYADDLTFSSDRDALPDVALVSAVLAGLGLSPHPKKTKLRRNGQSLYVTGYSVSGASPRAPRAMKRRLRQEMHFIEKFGFEGHVERLGRSSAARERDRLVGQIEHVRHAEPVHGAVLRERWDALATEIDVLPQTRRSSPDAVAIVVDDTMFAHDGKSYRALCAVALREPDNARRRIIALIDDMMLNPIMADRTREKVRVKGVHFTDLTEDFRRDAVQLAASLPMRAFIMFDRSAQDGDGQLRTFLRDLLTWRLSHCRGKTVTVILEQGSYVTEASAKALVSEIVAALPALDRPLEVAEVRVVGKLDEPCVALPDIYLGAWQHYGQNTNPQAPRAELLFTSLRRQLGTIYRPSTRRLFTARRPFTSFE